MQNVSSLSSCINYKPVDVNVQLIQALGQSDLVTVKFLKEARGAEGVEAAAQSELKSGRAWRQSPPARIFGCMRWVAKKNI